MPQKTEKTPFLFTFPGAMMRQWWAQYYICARSLQPWCNSLLNWLSTQYFTQCIYTTEAANMDIHYFINFLPGFDRTLERALSTDFFVICARCFFARSAHRLTVEAACIDTRRTDSAWVLSIPKVMTNSNVLICLFICDQCEIITIQSHCQI